MNDKDARIAALEAELVDMRDLCDNAMECGHLKANNQPTDEGPEMCIVCHELSATKKQMTDIREGLIAELNDKSMEIQALKRGPDDEAVREALAVLERSARVKEQYPDARWSDYMNAAFVVLASCRKAWARVAEYERMDRDCDCGSACEKAKGTAHRAIRDMRVAEAMLFDARRDYEAEKDRREKAERERDDWKEKAYRVGNQYASSEREVERLRAACASCGGKGEVYHYTQGEPCCRQPCSCQPPNPDEGFGMWLKRCRKCNAEWGYCGCGSAEGFKRTADAGGGVK